MRVRIPVATVAEPAMNTASRGAVSSPVRGRALVSVAVTADAVVVPSVGVEADAGCDVLPLLESGVGVGSGSGVGSAVPHLGHQFIIRDPLYISPLL